MMSREESILCRRLHSVERTLFIIGENIEKTISALDLNGENKIKVFPIASKGDCRNTVTINLWNVFFIPKAWKVSAVLLNPCIGIVEEEELGDKIVLFRECWHHQSSSCREDEDPGVSHVDTKVGQRGGRRTGCYPSKTRLRDAIYYASTSDLAIVIGVDCKHVYSVMLSVLASKYGALLVSIGSKCLSFLSNVLFFRSAKSFARVLEHCFRSHNGMLGF